MGTTTQLNIEFLRKFEQKEIDYWSDYYSMSEKNILEECGIYSSRDSSGFNSAMSNIDILAFNRVIGLGAFEEITEEQIESIINFYKQRNVPRFFVQVPPFAAPNNFESLLGSKGFKFHNNWVKLYKEIDDFYPEVETDLEIITATEEHKNIFSEIIYKAFEWPKNIGKVLSQTLSKGDWKHFIALDSDKPIAVSALHIKNELASLAIAGTLPEHRGKGAQNVLIAKRINYAKQTGCKYMVVETAEDIPGNPSQSFKNIIKKGFEVAYSRANYLMEL